MSAGVPKAYRSVQRPTRWLSISGPAHGEPVEILVVGVPVTIRTDFKKIT